MNELEPLLISDLRALIEEAKTRVARTVNQEMTLLYWRIGQRIQQDILKFERAEYGRGIITSLAKTLTMEYGKGFHRSSLIRMIQFYEAFPQKEIVATLSQQLSWSHFIEILPIQDELKRTFYAELCRVEGWSVRILREKIGKMLFERTAISKEPEQVIRDSLKQVRSNERFSAKMLFQDPYLLDFLSLPELYNEKDLESSILDKIQRFLLEMGAGFCFVARQKRISVGNRDYVIDLLLYNRYLRRLVVIELKTEEFKPAHKGQMEFYLKWLNKNERRGDDDSPIGIILCTEKDEEQISIFDLEESSIHVAEYWIALPPKEVFEEKIREIIRESRERYETEDLLEDLKSLDPDEI